MLEEIEIKNLGVIADARLPLSPGFTAITGETGAGKTMVITALGLLMGLRSDSGTVRSGASRATVSGTLNATSSEVELLVEDAGGEVEAGELTLIRSVDSEGRSRASAGGARVPAGVLQKLAPKLFAVHGQSEQLRLRSAKEQRDTLDRFGGDKLLAAKTRYEEAFEALEKLRKEEDELVTNETERNREAARLEVEVAEITEANATPGELDEVRHRVQKLGSLEDLRQGVMNAKTLLAGDEEGNFTNAATTLISGAVRELEKIKEDDEELAAVYDQALSLALQLDELVRDLGGYANTLDMDGPAELARASERLEVLNSLTRKYGPSLEDVFNYLEEAESKLASTGSAHERLQVIEQLIRDAENSVQLRGTELTALREAAAAELSKKVSAELKTLALKDAEFRVEIIPSKPSLSGFETVEMQLMPHPGAAPRPIAKGASGGELSRVMLALEVVLAGRDPVPTFVFDEVDAGVGGSAALEIGRRLAKLAESAQVIVVTHLAQVAAFANQHIAIQKDSSGGFTKSSTRVLEGEERVLEMARLMSGVTDSESALQHARELLQQNFRLD